MRYLVLLGAGLIVLALVGVGCTSDSERIADANDAAGGAPSPQTQERDNDISIFDLRVGDCYVSGPRVEAEVGSVELTACSSRSSRVDDLIRVPEQASYPGDRYFETLANSQCPASTTNFLLPTDDSWSAGDRVVVCIRE